MGFGNDQMIFVGQIPEQLDSLMTILGLRDLEG